MDRLSIIVPIYNQEKYLEECLDSILYQDIEAYQVLLIDDGSTDMSKEICQRYVKKDLLFRYIYQNNSGLGKARNTGLEYAKGTYILFLDADDMLAKNCLKTLIDYMDDQELDILYVDEMICDERMKAMYVSPTYPNMKTQINKTQALEYCMQPSHICSRIYKRALFKNIRFENMWYEDMACFPELLSISRKIGYYKAPVYYYRQHEGAITHQDMDSRNLDVIKAWDKGIHLSSLSEVERNAFIMTIIKSITTFLFFKMQYASEYITWYRKVLEGRTVIQKEEDIVQKELELSDNYPFIQQAKLAGDWVLVERLNAVKKLYLEGGFYYFTKPNENKEALQAEHLSFTQEPDLGLYSIKVKPNSIILYCVNKELRKQNLISLNGERKQFILEKILVQAFMEHGFPVRIL